MKKIKGEETSAVPPFRIILVHYAVCSSFGAVLMLVAVVSRGFRMRSGRQFKVVFGVEACKLYLFLDRQVGRVKICVSLCALRLVSRRLFPLLLDPVARLLRAILWPVFDFFFLSNDRVIFWTYFCFHFFFILVSYWRYDTCVHNSICCPLYYQEKGRCSFAYKKKRMRGQL